jgi:hypothetical protein
MSSQQSSPGMSELDLADMVVENPVSNSPIGVDEFPESPNNNIEIASPPWYENEENTPEQQNATYFTNSSPLRSRNMEKEFDQEQEQEQEPKRQRIEGGRRKTNKRKSRKSRKSKKSKKSRKSRKPRSYKKRGGGSSVSDDQDRNNLNFTSSNK